MLSVLQVSSVPEVDICIYRERETQRARARPTHTQREGVCGASSVLEVNICIYQERETHTRKEREMMREKEGMSARKRGSAHKRTGCPHKRNSWQTCAGQSSPSRQHGSSTPCVPYLPAILAPCGPYTVPLTNHTCNGR